MTLMECLKEVTVSKLLFPGHLKDIEIGKLAYDSRKVSKGDVFIAIRGLATDGHKFIENAVNQGALAVVMEDEKILPDSYFRSNHIVKVLVKNSRRALAIMARNFFHQPDKKLLLVGITGTNGKTTISYLIKSIFENTGHKVGLIGTVDYYIGSEKIEAPFTTPESLELHEIFDKMVTAQCDSCVMEVSSHALTQDRVYGVEYDVAVFTNLTQDHLDFHGTMENYFQAKAKLFKSLDEDAIAILNIDDPKGKELVKMTKAQTVTFAKNKSTADVWSKDVKYGLRMNQFILKTKEREYSISSPLPGMFNLDNALAAFTVGYAMKLDEQKLIEGLQRVSMINGRFERVSAGQDFTVIVDYAHTPNALENVLVSLRQLRKTKKETKKQKGGRRAEEYGAGRIITVFGCGGDRDRDKRPLMGKIAAEYSDFVIVTSDNPRSENPEEIINQILEPFHSVNGAESKLSKNIERITDREHAIRHAIELAQPGDFILLAGKGHETYQVVGKYRRHFDDREIAYDAIKEKLQLLL
jgi:UDP-N-acetylmuramoyl-L-alanyl-D-glutamate--2,6-diaminopimelate ligase